MIRVLQKALLDKEQAISRTERGGKDWTDVERLIRKLDNSAVSQSLYS